MKRPSYPVILLLFVAITSMSDCEKVKGPETVVTGSVTDFSTNEGYDNVVLQVKREMGGIDQIFYEGMDTVITDAQGNYRLTFIPMGLGARFSLDYKHHDLKQYGIAPYFTGTSNEIELGKVNTIDFKVKKLVNLRVHLVNKSDQDHSNFQLSSDCHCISFNRSTSSNTKIPVDTILNFKVPRLSTIQIASRFYDLGNTLSKQVLFTKDFTIANSDTTLKIVNP